MATPDYRNQYQNYRRYFTSLGHFYQTQPEVKLYLELVLTLTTITLLAVFAIRPTALTIIQLTQDIKTQQKTDQLLDQKITSLNLAQTNYQKLQSDLKVLDLALPTSPLPASFLLQIESLAASESLTLSSLSLGDIYLIGAPSKNPSATPETSSLPTNTESVNFSLTVQGNYPSLKTFLQYMENLQRLNIITELNFSQALQNQENSASPLSLTINGQLPFSKSKSQTTSQP